MPHPRTTLAVALVSGLVSAASSARAGQTQEIALDCSRLDQKQAEELKARIHLALGAVAGPRSVLVACDADRAWVVWDGPPLELLHVRGSGELVEAILETVEQRLGQARPAPKATPEPAAPPTATANLDAGPSEGTNEGVSSPASVGRPPKPQRQPRTGGFGLGITVEAPSEHWPVAYGPRLDVGVGVADFALALSESVRSAEIDSPLSSFQFDTELGLGWGAPYAPGRWFGAALLSGLEWVSTDNLGLTTKSSAFASLSLRAAAPHWPLAPWFGLDLRYRFTPQRFNTLSDDQKPHFALIFSFAALLRADEIIR